MFKFKEWVTILETELFISRARIYNKREQKYILRKWISQFDFTIYFCLIKKKTLQIYKYPYSKCTNAMYAR